MGSGEGEAAIVLHEIPKDSLNTCFLMDAPHSEAYKGETTGEMQNCPSQFPLDFFPRAWYNPSIPKAVTETGSGGGSASERARVVRALSGRAGSFPPELCG